MTVILRHIYSTMLPVTAFIRIRTLVSYFAFWFSFAFEIFAELFNVLFYFAKFRFCQFCQINNLKQLIKFQVAMTDIGVINMNKADFLYIIPKLCKNIMLIGNIVLVNPVHGRGTLNFVKFNFLVSKITENVHAAETPVITE